MFSPSSFVNKGVVTAAATITYAPTTGNTIIITTVRLSATLASSTPTLTGGTGTITLLGSIASGLAACGTIGVWAGTGLSTGITSIASTNATVMAVSEYKGVWQFAGALTADTASAVSSLDFSALTVKWNRPGTLFYATAINTNNTITTAAPWNKLTDSVTYNTSRRFSDCYLLNQSSTTTGFGGVVGTALAQICFGLYAGEGDFGDGSW